MMSLLSRLLRKKKTVGSATISVIGPSKGGKTTLIRYLETERPVEEEPFPTLGLDYRNNGVSIDDWELSLIDVGGQKMFQQAFWELAISQAQGVIYVLDATIRPESNMDRFKEQLDQFIYALDLIPESSIVQFLLNKQDLHHYNPIQPEEFANYYPLDQLHGRSFSFMGVSAKYGKGVEPALKWFVERIAEYDK